METVTVAALTSAVVKMKEKNKQCATAWGLGGEEGVFSFSYTSMTYSCQTSQVGLNEAI